MEPNPHGGYRGTIKFTQEDFVEHIPIIDMIVGRVMEAAGVVLGVVQVALRPAVQELSIKIDPRSWIRGDEPLAIDAVSSDAVLLFKCGERQLLAENR